MNKWWILNKAAAAAAKKRKEIVNWIWNEWWNMNKKGFKQEFLPKSRVNKMDQLLKFIKQIQILFFFHIFLIQTQTMFCHNLFFFSIHKFILYIKKFINRSFLRLLILDEHHPPTKKKFDACVFIHLCHEIIFRKKWQKEKTKHNDDEYQIISNKKWK